MVPSWIVNRRMPEVPSLAMVMYLSLQLQVLCTATKVIEEFACFNTVFEIGCHENEVIVFDTARYGRNDTVVATRCQVPYQRNCDVDVHFPLNRVCAGKPKCSLAVNTALFGDPCGYEEFLTVVYRCVAVSTVQQTCFGPNGPNFYDHGFLASPNYPGKYFMDADCHWKLSVQKRQRITMTILDFELDVKRGGQCYDYLEISAGDKVYFNDCGALGKQLIQVDSSKALVHFKTGHGSLTQRGFLIYFEAYGPGCPDLEQISHGETEYFIDDDVLYANVTCIGGFHFSGTDSSHQLVQCAGSFWDTVLTPCIASTPPTTPTIPVTSTDHFGDKPPSEDSGSLIGIALGIVSAILLITLLLVLALYFHKRRRNAERKLDQWRFVINNLQESTANEENLKRATLEGSGINVMTTPPSNMRKEGKRGKKTKKVNNKEDEWQGRNLLTSPNYDEEDMLDIMALDPRDMETMMKYPMPLTDEELFRQHQLSRKNSKSARYSLARSRDGQLDNSSIWVECDPKGQHSGKMPNRKDFRHKRAKSGQWDPPTSNRSFVVPAQSNNYAVPGGLRKNKFTQSAPDILNLVEPPPLIRNGDVICCHTEAYQPHGVARNVHPNSHSTVPSYAHNTIPATTPYTSHSVNHSTMPCSTPYTAHCTTHGATHGAIQGNTHGTIQGTIQGTNHGAIQGSNHGTSHNHGAIQPPHIGRSATMTTVPPPGRSHRTNMGPPPRPPPRSSTTHRC